MENARKQKQALLKEEQQRWTRKEAVSLAWWEASLCTDCGFVSWEERKFSPWGTAVVTQPWEYWCASGTSAKEGKSACTKALSFILDQLSHGTVCCYGIMYEVTFPPEEFSPFSQLGAYAAKYIPGRILPVTQQISGHRHKSPFLPEIDVVLECGAEAGIACSFQVWHWLAAAWG